MAVASFSNEASIRKQLQDIGCSESAFAIFNGIVGRTRFFEAMRGEPGKHFSQQDAERLLEIISEMHGLQKEVDVPINWGCTDQIGIALIGRRIARIAAEMNDTSFDATA